MDNTVRVQIQFQMRFTAGRYNMTDSLITPLQRPNVTENTYAHYCVHGVNPLIAIPINSFCVCQKKKGKEPKLL